MVTTVGTETRVEDLVSNLLYLEHDAIAAYDSTIDKLQNAGSKQQVAAFRDDHLKGLAELEKMASMLKIDVPQGGDIKQVLTTGKIALASLVGDGAILKAMKTNEDDTVTAYERAARHQDAKPESQRYFERFAADERRHRAWMEQASTSA